MKTVIIDYNCGNLKSIKNIIQRIGYECEISNEFEIITSAENIILPGVGSFDYGVKMLKKLNLFDYLKGIEGKNQRLLGICLGMQLMFNKSEEGVLSGLSLIDGEVVGFRNNEYPIPHMGWNSINVIKENPLLDIKDEQRFYFTHSFRIDCFDKNAIVGTTIYNDHFVSAVHSGNIFGVQFHPEKSHKFGMKLFERFLSQ